MNPVSWVRISLLAVGMGALGAVISGALVVSGRSPLTVTPWLAAMFGVLAVILLWGGLGVRRFKSRRDGAPSALQVARVAAFARATLITGSAFTGFLAGVAVIGYLRPWAEAMLQAGITASIASVGALLMTVIAGIVERWCRDDSSENGPGQKAGAS